MNHLKSFDLFNEGFLDLFKSKQPKQLSFSEEEMRYITDELSDLISNFDAQHTNGDVSTKHMIPRKAKKEYSIIDLRCVEYYSRSEHLNLQCFKTRFYENGEFVVKYHFGGDISRWNRESVSEDTIQKFVSKLKKVIISWKIHIIILNPFGVKYHLETIMRLADEYNVIRDGKVVEFRLKEMIDEISDHNVRKVTNDSRMKPFKKYDDEHNRIIKRLKAMNVEFV